MSDDSSVVTWLRSKYAVKLFGISLLIVTVIGAAATVLGLQVSGDVTEKQLETVEKNAELEAESLGSWFKGSQEIIRVLSAHEKISPSNISQTRKVFDTELTQQSGELVSLHLTERATDYWSNGTTEQIIASSDNLEQRPLSATDINWGEEPNGDDREFSFENGSDILVSWVYRDNPTSSGRNMSVAIASPTPDGDHVLVGEFHPSIHIDESTNVIDGSHTVVLGGVSAFVIFEEGGLNDFRRYKEHRHSSDVDSRNTTEVGSQILTRDDPFSIINGSAVDGNEVRGYHSVPGQGVDWVVVKETPRSNALAVPDQVQTGLASLIGIMFLGFLLIGAVIQYGPLRSVQELATEANAIAEGDLNVEIGDENRRDEIGELRKSFRQTIQRQKRRQRELEKRNERLDQFASFVSHDLRNPLGVAQTYLDFARESGDPDDFDAVSESIERMDSMIEDLLTMARAGTTIDDYETVDLARLVTEAWETAQTDGAELVHQIDDEEVIEADGSLLRTVFENLFRNATDHNEPPLTVRVGVAGNVIYVEDNGTGIPEADRREVFDHGYTTGAKSTGLGLSIVSDIIDAHGWEIVVTDGRDGGARFEIDTGTTDE